MHSRSYLLLIGDIIDQEEPEFEDAFYEGVFLVRYLRCPGPFPFHFWEKVFSIREELMVCQLQLNTVGILIVFCMQVETSSKALG